MGNKIFFWSLTVALAGFLFGFDTIVISGAEGTLDARWSAYTLFGEHALFHGIVVVSSALWGTVVGALFGGIPTDRLGRKQTLFWIGVLYTVSALGSALVSDPYLFAAFRFVGGLGVGASTIAAPAYIAEIAPASDRGRLTALYQFNIVFGILVAFASNYLLSGIETDNWRYMIGVESIPAVLYTLLVLTVPRSPRWLIAKRDDRTEAARILRLLNPDRDVQPLVDEIVADHARAPRNERVFNGKFSRPLLLAFLIAFFNQFSGINALLYYAPRVFEAAGLEGQAAFLGSGGIGVANLIFTLLGVLLIDRLGRRQLMFIGSVGYIVSLSAVAYAFATGMTGLFIPVMLFVFIGAHAIGQGTVIWVFISEIFPNHVRAAGTSFGTSTHWVLAAAIPAAIPFLFDTIGAATVFGLFAFMMVLQLVWVWQMMPETKGVPLEALDL